MTSRGRRQDHPAAYLAPHAQALAAGFSEGGGQRPDVETLWSEVTAYRLFALVLRQVHVLSFPP